MERRGTKLIKIDDVTKTFGDVTSLKNVSFPVDSGSIFGLIGSNGSGKSTLLRVLSGVYKPDSGSVFVDGMPVWEKPEVKSRICYISDDLYFPNRSTPSDMADLYGSLYSSFERKLYFENLKNFGLDKDRRLNQFSKGMQKQTAFLLGLASRCDIMLCDEVLDGLDPVMRRSVRQVIAADVAERNTTVVFASHNLKEVEDICDHIAMLHKGEVLFNAGLDDIRTGIHKIQLSFKKEDADEAENELKKIKTVSLDRRGSLFTIVARGDENELGELIAGMNPLFAEFIPLTLEEVFISEMEERGYEYNKEVLC